MELSTINEGGLDNSPLETRPETVAIVALGHSSHAYTRMVMSNGNLTSPFDEVWTVNRGFRAFAHDKLFVMDDLKWLEEERPEYAAFLKQHDKPIITSTRYDDYPTSVEYPVQYVMETIEDDIFCVNTVAYMVAYAIHIRVKNVHIYGADFCYPDGNKSESGGQAVAYLCGMMRQFGMFHHLPGESTLLYADQVRMQPNGTQARIQYGYHRKAQLAEKKAKEKQMIEQRAAARTGA